MRDARSTIRTIRKTAALVVMTLAGLSMFAADTLSDGTLFRFAVTAWLIAATTYITPRTGVTVRVLERERQRGYEAGYDGGYADGHEIGYGKGRQFPRPVLLSQSAGGARRKAFPLDRAAQ